MLHDIKPPDPPVELTVDELEADLAGEPWLRAYLEPGDVDLTEARRRFEVDQIAALRQLRRANVAVAMRYHRGALQTTSIDERSVRPPQGEP